MNNRVSLEQKLEYLVKEGFNINFSLSEGNKENHKVVGIFNTYECEMTITGKDVKSVILTAYENDLSS